ncbi:Protein of unknown function (DUF581 [Striga hermonthica]|uniref:FLZ-type domain-containing protein n=1 Tax=Striga hermonthica TaxID=68872 RepID=A0A9N7R6A9_STRHE|nr:Protein of unknown function (DUF581 [Striga hermonthica]
MKRSRNGSSSRNRDGQVADNDGIEDDGEEPRSAIFSIGFPVRAGRYNPVKLGDFLERCYYCKDLIPRNTEVFMYGILCAFCTIQCRDLQIAKDRAARRNPARVEFTANQGHESTM